MRTKILEIWSKHPNIKDKSNEICELFNSSNISDTILPKTTANELINEIQSKFHEELEEMRKKLSRDAINMKYYEHPRFHGLDAKNIRESKRQVGILRSKKIKNGENCNLLNLENKLAVKKNLYENFGIDIPMKLVRWEFLEDEFDDDKKLQKKKKDKKVLQEDKEMKEVEEEVFQDNIDNKENEIKDDGFLRSYLADPTRPMIITNLMETNFDAPKKLTFSKVVIVKE